MVKLDFNLGDTLASPVKLTCLSVKALPGVSVDMHFDTEGSHLIQIICRHPGSKSFVHEMCKKVNTSTKDCMWNSIVVLVTKC